MHIMICNIDMISIIDFYSTRNINFYDLMKANFIF